MIFLSGVYYPTAQLPGWLQVASNLLPLSAAVQLVRPLILGQWPLNPLFNVAVLVVYCVGAFYLATLLTRRRLLN
jgi:lipooligosaccharide transport system permease protein